MKNVFLLSAIVFVLSSFMIGLVHAQWTPINVSVGPYSISCPDNNLSGTITIQYANGVYAQYGYPQIKLIEGNIGPFGAYTSGSAAVMATFVQDSSGTFYDLTIPLVTGQQTVNIYLPGQSLQDTNNGILAPSSDMILYSNVPTNTCN
jgi:hypothetical protein